jgi:hypothetical protein
MAAVAEIKLATAKSGQQKRIVRSGLEVDSSWRLCSPKVNRREPELSGLSMEPGAKNRIERSKTTARPDRRLGRAVSPSRPPSWDSRLTRR